MGAPSPADSLHGVTPKARTPRRPRGAFTPAERLILSHRRHSGLLPKATLPLRPTLSPMAILKALSRRNDGHQGGRDNLPYSIHHYPVAPSTPRSKRASHEMHTSASPRSRMSHERQTPASPGASRAQYHSSPSARYFSVQDSSNTRAHRSPHPISSPGTLRAVDEEDGSVHFHPLLSSRSGERRTSTEHAGPRRLTTEDPLAMSSPDQDTSARKSPRHSWIHHMEPPQILDFEQQEREEAEKARIAMEKIGVEEDEDEAEEGSVQDERAGVEDQDVQVHEVDIPIEEENRPLEQEVETNDDLMGMDEGEDWEEVEEEEDSRGQTLPELEEDRLGADYSSEDGVEEDFPGLDELPKDEEKEGEVVVAPEPTNLEVSEEEELSPREDELFPGEDESFPEEKEDIIGLRSEDPIQEEILPDETVLWGEDMDHGWEDQDEDEQGENPVGQQIDPGLLSPSPSALMDQLDEDVLQNVRQVRLGSSPRSRSSRAPPPSIPPTPTSLMRTLDKNVAAWMRERPPRSMTSTSSASHPRKARSIRLSKRGYPVPGLPKSLVTSLTRQRCHGVTLRKEVIQHIMDASHDFFESVAEDLSVYARHGKRRKRIEASDAICLMRRQRLLKEEGEVSEMARQALPRELSDLLCPAATTGNLVSGPVASSGRRANEGLRDS
ncbi:hypothetical protein BJ684DRAFT_20010 [Piptocephalis cylindrospora]|uniref:CENP-T/Histone H4 histone fold domain-containing protein n=1 Tax=Piptocephalis cylindrospora TaxID=1907219 RepID=A0A4P9Y449_9FUNG|nr:hypothetical protein BJ684DRAFT_20010 [Piptocephalis cylindrospora]|eukprot:RKP13504.1 hypothetical protein BJ684DRAFT_20010 [Piptocephalis cylindrospora]